MSGDPENDDCIVALEPCGCIAGVSVLTGMEASAYKFAAQEAKEGRRIETWTVRAFHAKKSWHCDEHPNGPPWWKSRGGNGRRPAAETMGLGL